MISRRQTLAGLATTAAAVTPFARGTWDPRSISPTQPRPMAGPGLVPRPDPRAGLMLGFGVSRERPTDVDWQLQLTVLDLDTHPVQMLRIPLRHFAHGIVPHPRRPQHVVVFQKRGQGASEINLAAGRVSRPIETTADREFYGHGCFSADGSLLFCTETVVSGNYRGLVAVRDADSYTLLGEFPSHGTSPHDCRLVDNGRVLAITNGGGPIDGTWGSPPNVAWVDVASGRLLDRVVLDDPTLNAGHLAIGVAGDLVVVSSFREGREDVPDVRGGISVRPAGAALRTLTEPVDLIARLYGETLSVSIDDARGRFAATTPQGNLLTFWDLRTGELLRSVDLPQPKGVALTLDGRHYAVSYTYQGRALLGLWSTRTLERVEGLDLLDTYISGSHLTAYALPV